MLRRDMTNERLALEVKFRALVCEWALGPGQVAKLLHVQPGRLGLDLVPLAPNSEVEHRLRLLVEIRSMLSWLVPDEASIPIALRDEGGERGFIDGRGEPVGSLLSFMSGSRAQLTSLVRTLRLMANG